MSPAELARALRGIGRVHKAISRRPGPFEAVAEVLDFGRHVPPQSTAGDRFNSTNSYVYIIDRNSIVSIRSTPVSLLAEAGRNLIGTFRRTTKSKPEC